MSQHDDDPVAQDDFPEFAAPPQQRPPAHPPEPGRDPEVDARQEGVDGVLERLRREREQGKR